MVGTYSETVNCRFRPIGRAVVAGAFQTPALGLPRSIARRASAVLMRTPVKNRALANQGLKGPGYGSFALRAKSALAGPSRMAPGKSDFAMNRKARNEWLPTNEKPTDASPITTTPIAAATYPRYHELSYSDCLANS